MTRPLNVLVLDDNTVTALSPLNQFVAHLPGDDDRFLFTNLTDPSRLDTYLNAHPETDVVLVDVSFDESSTNSTLTCLTAFNSLIGRGGPKAIGLAQSQYGRTLFPFAVCQLLPPPPSQIVVGWTYKDDNPERGYPRTIRILDEIASGRSLRQPSTLLRCIPGVVHGTGDFISTILADRLDVRLWDLMSTTHYSAEDLALTSGVGSPKAVRKRFDVYLKAIEDFEIGMEADDVHPFGGQAVRNLPSRSTDTSSGRDPRVRAIEAFAQTHRTFFQAPELEDIVVRCELRKSRQAGRRSRRRPQEAWWKSEGP